MTTEAIIRGIRWTQRLTVEGATTPYFPSGVQVRSQVRQNDYSPTALVTLTTENGGIERVNDYAINITLTAEQTALLGVGRVAMDLLRMDTTYPMNYGITIRPLVVQGITSAS